MLTVDDMAAMRVVSDPLERDRLIAATNVWLRRHSNNDRICGDKILVAEAFVALAHYFEDAQAALHHLTY